MFWNHTLKSGEVGLTKPVSKAWGQESWIINSSLYCGKILAIDQGHTLSIHFHMKKDETWCLLEGLLEVSLIHKTGDLQIITLNPGEVLHIPAGLMHTFKSLAPRSTILEISTTHDDEDSYRATKSE